MAHPPILLPSRTPNIHPPPSTHPPGPPQSTHPTSTTLHSLHSTYTPYPPPTLLNLHLHRPTLHSPPTLLTLHLHPTLHSPPHHTLPIPPHSPPSTSDPTLPPFHPLTLHLPSIPLPSTLHSPPHSLSLHRARSHTAKWRRFAKKQEPSTTKQNPG